MGYYVCNGGDALKYFVSDTHFNHLNIIKYCDRPFNSTEEMSEVLIKNWNRVVSDNDTVYFLGDFSMSLEAVLEITPLLNGKKHMIAGNHDRCFSRHRSGRKPHKALEIKQQYYAAGWESIAEKDTITVAGIEVNMCHFPYNYSRDSMEDDGKWLLYGHTHDSTQLKLQDRMINVGVDCNNYTPISEDYIKEIIDDNS